MYTAPPIFVTEAFLLTNDEIRGPSWYRTRSTHFNLFAGEAGAQHIKVVRRSRVFEVQALTSKRLQIFAGIEVTKPHNEGDDSCKHHPETKPNSDMSQLPRFPKCSFPDLDSPWPALACCS